MHSTSCDACPLRRRDAFVPLSPEELEFQKVFKVGEMVIERGSTILLEGSASPQLYTVLSGMGLRYKTLENGRRQVLNFIMPGDLLGLQAGIMGEMKHSAEATTDMVLCVFERRNLWQLFRNQPERAFDVTWLAATEEHLLGETVATLGQRDATERIAWAMTRIHERLVHLGLNRGGVPFPYRQQDLADALGLSLVHTNKTLSRLSERGLVTWSNGRLILHDPDALAEIAMVPKDAPERRPLI